MPNVCPELMGLCMLREKSANLVNFQITKFSVSNEFIRRWNRKGFFRVRLGMTQPGGRRERHTQIYSKEINLVISDAEVNRLPKQGSTLI